MSKIILHKPAVQEPTYVELPEPLKSYCTAIGEAVNVFGEALNKGLAPYIEALAPFAEAYARANRKREKPRCTPATRHRSSVRRRMLAYRRTRRQAE